MVAAWRVTQQSGEHGSVNAGFNNGVFSATIIDSGRTIWSGSISVLPLALLIAVPPLILWLIWLAASARTNNADERSLTEKSPSGLRAAEPRIGIIEASTSSTSKRRAREES
jgi:hypothetical protein